MEINKGILQKYLEQATIEQLESEYIKKGYEVFREHKIKDRHLDLMARKDKDIIVFEIKSGTWTDARREVAQQLRNFAVHELGANYKLVLVNLPKEADVVVDGLDAIFPDLLADEFIDEFSRLATHFIVDEVSDINFDELFIRKSEIEIKGSAIVSLELQYGSNSDVREGDGLGWTESFSFDFHLLLNENLDVKEVLSLELDSPEDLE
jgi:hypothetical protein